MHTSKILAFYIFLLPCFCLNAAPGSALISIQGEVKPDFKIVDHSLLPQLKSLTNKEELNDINFDCNFSEVMLSAGEIIGFYSLQFNAAENNINIACQWIDSRYRQSGYQRFLSERIHLACHSICNTGREL